LLYTYKKFLTPATGEKKKAGLYYSFNMEAFMKSLPHDQAEYIAHLSQTQGKYTATYLTKELKFKPDTV
jgi:hypothetical protein